VNEIAADEVVANMNELASVLTQTFYDSLPICNSKKSGSPLFYSTVRPCLRFRAWRHGNHYKLLPDESTLRNPKCFIALHLRALFERSLSCRTAV